VNLLDQRVIDTGRDVVGELGRRQGAGKFTHFGGEFIAQDLGRQHLP